MILRESIIQSSKNYTQTALVFSAIFPVYYSILYFTKDRLVATLSTILLSTYPALAELDAHFLSLRALSTSFLAFGIYFLFVKKSGKIAGLLLGCFSLSVFSNAFVSAALVASYLLGQWIYSRNNFRQNLSFVLIWITISALGFLALLWLPGSWDNLIGYHLNRSYFTPINRYEWVKASFLQNSWPFLLPGFLGSFLFLKKFKLFGIFNILTFVCILFLGSSYYPHYLIVMVPGLAITAGMFFSLIHRFLVARLLLVGLVFVSIYIGPYKALKASLIDKTTPEFYLLSKALSEAPGPVFTYQPIYGLYSKKELTFHYNVADMRYFSVVGSEPDITVYNDIISRSNTILLTSWDFLSLPESVKTVLNESFEPVYVAAGGQIYVRKFY